MDLSIQIAPIGNTTSREIFSASHELRETLEHLPGISRVEPYRIPAPEHAKGVLVDVLGRLAVSVAPDLLKGTLQTIHSILCRQPAMAKVVIEIKDSKVNFEFDPKTISLGELMDAAERFRAAASSG